MHILEISTDRLPSPPPAGGAIERYVWNISKGLAQRSYKVHLISVDRNFCTYRFENIYRHTFPYNESCWEEKFIMKLSTLFGAPIYGRLPYVTRMLLSLFKKIRQRYGPFDVVHAHFFTTLLAPIIYREYFDADITCIASYHNIPKRNFINLYFAKKYDRLLGVSKFVCLELMRKFDVPKDKVGLVYNAVDTDLFKPNEYLRKKLRENWGIKDDEIVFLFAGRIVPEKGLDYLIKAFARVQMNLLNKNIKSRLIIAGPKGHFDAKIPSYYNYIQKLVKELNIQDKVIYIGYLQNIHEVYNMADIVVVPSVREEACPSVILEAMATGKPVVAYAKGGIPELLEDSPHGYLVNNVSDGALALCMEKAVNSLSNLDANALRGYVEKRFSINAVVDALIDDIKRL